MIGSLARAPNKEKRVSVFLERDDPRNNRHAPGRDFRRAANMHPTNLCQPPVVIVVYSSNRRPNHHASRHPNLVRSRCHYFWTRMNRQSHRNALVDHHFSGLEEGSR